MSVHAAVSASPVLKFIPVAALAVLLGGCGGGLLPGSGATSPTGDTGSSLGNLVRYGTTTLPPVLQEPEEEIDCPAVQISPGGAALRIGAGGSSEGVRSQITITDVARECVRNGGMLVLRVGAEGRVLVGPAGSAGSLGATLRIDVRRGDTVLSSRTARVGASIPSGESQAAWTHVEQGISIPVATLRAGGDTDVFVTLGGAASQPSRRRR